MKIYFLFACSLSLSACGVKGAPMPKSKSTYIYDRNKESEQESQRSSTRFSESDLKDMLKIDLNNSEYSEEKTKKKGK